MEELICLPSWMVNPTLELFLHNIGLRMDLVNEHMAISRQMENEWLKEQMSR